jgi:adenylosuccinate synthase
MPVIAIIGAQWGDEGKGRVVDLITEKADVVVRYSGGDNAGHTVINNLGKFALHLIPSGIFSKGAVSVIGNGVVINPKSLFTEMDMLTSRGVDISPARLSISDRAQLIMPYHLLLDKLEEKSLGNSAIGTTLKGIGPVYSDKVARRGIRVGDLLDKKAFKVQLKAALDRKNLVLTRIYGVEPLALEPIYDEYVAYGQRLQPYIQETTLTLNEALENGKTILLEGAQGTLLDPDFGTYPFTTSSSPIAGGASIGTGIGPNKMNVILGVYKAYCTRVGGGPFPTELNDAVGNQIRERAHEFGTTTGRPRRCGWFDGVAARFSQRVNGFTGMVITRFDILDVLPTLKVCTAYKLDGNVINYFPANIDVLARCEPVYEELPGWLSSTENIRKYKDLPVNAKNYVKRMEELSGCPANLIGVGPAREQIIEKSPII